MNTEQKHAQEWTAEPWEYYAGGGITAGNRVVAIMGLPDEPTSDTNTANAARIVACVNALAGVEDPAAYIASLLDALSIKQDMPYARLEAQRDELLKACEGVLHHDEAMRAPFKASPSLIAHIKTAIANAQK